MLILTTKLYKFYIKKQIRVTEKIYTYVGKILQQFITNNFTTTFVYVEPHT